MKYFPEHLTYLCQRFPSKAEVARKLGINRSQFVRYLTGKSAPSAYNLHRICEFFSIRTGDLDLSPSEFVASYPISFSLADADKSQPDLAHYVGWYFDYSLSSFDSGKVCKSLVRVWRDGDQIRYLQIRRVPSLRKMKAVHMTEQGSVSFESGVLRFVCDNSTDCSSNQTLVMPALPLRHDYCFGIRLATSHNSLRGPYATRVTLEHLGNLASFRFWYRQLGLYDYGAKELGGVSRTLKNEYAQDEWRLRSFGRGDF